MDNDKTVAHAVTPFAHSDRGARAPKRLPIYINFNNKMPLSGCSEPFLDSGILTAWSALAGA
jgi:hypothetical protein